MKRTIDTCRPLRTLTDVARANLVRLDTDLVLKHRCDDGLTRHELTIPRWVSTPLSTGASYSELITFGDRAVQAGYFEAARRAFAAAGAVERLLALADLCMHRRCCQIARRALENIIEGTDGA